MSIKIAVATNDGNSVNLHFGRTRIFWIYQLTEAGYEFLEQREITAPCSGQAHDNKLLELASQTLSDCRGVICAQIGAGAIDALIMNRVIAFTLPGSIDDAFSVIIRSGRFFPPPAPH